MNSSVNASEALNMIRNGEAVLVDVRESEEFKEEHIVYALSIPLGSVEEGVRMLDLPGDRVILFQCLKGSRGQMACQRVGDAKASHNKVMNVEGGIEAWKVAGLPVIGKTSQRTKLSIFRQVQIIVGFMVGVCVLIGFLGITGAFLMAGLLGIALFVAGLTGWCGLAVLLGKMPWNK